MFLFDNAKKSSDTLSLAKAQTQSIADVNSKLNAMTSKNSQLSIDIKLEREKSKELSKEITLLQDKIKSVEESEETLKHEMKIKVKELSDKATSLEILTKRCAALEKDKNGNNQKIASLEATQAEDTGNRNELLQKIASLEQEITSHKEINQNLISSSSGDNTVQSKSPCEACKSKTNEIKSLKDMICVHESSIKDFEKASVSRNSELYAAKLEVQREKAINNILIRFDPSQISTDKQSPEQTNSTNDGNSTALTGNPGNANNPDPLAERS